MFNIFWALNLLERALTRTQQMAGMALCQAQRALSHIQKSARNKHEVERKLVRCLFEQAMRTLHLIEKRAPLLWAKEAPKGLYGRDGVISLLTDWLGHNPLTDINAIEDMRERFHDSLETVRHLECGMDGHVLSPQAMAGHAERNLGGLVGSAFQIILTMASCIELPDRQGFHPSLSERAALVHRSLREAEDRLRDLTLEARPSLSLLGRLEENLKMVLS